MAKDFNKVIVSGRLGKDVELRVTPSGTTVATFSVACSRNIKEGENWKEQTEWFRVVAWNTLADRCATLLKKGSHVLIEGRLQTREWNDNEGQNHQTTEVIANEMYLLGSKRSEGEETEAAKGEGQLAFEEDLVPEGIPF